MKKDVRVLLYGDVNLNIIDGSAVWLQSMTTVLAAIERVDLTVVLKASEERDLLTASIRAQSGIRVINPIDEGTVKGTAMTRWQALDELERIDREGRYDIIIMRGFDLCHTASQRPNRHFHGRLWSYCTRIPQHASEISDKNYNMVSNIAEASKYILCQTEAMRCFLESYFPETAHKAILLTPMIPDFELKDLPELVGQKQNEEKPLRLVYIGKFAPLWNTLEMTQAVAQLRADGENVELHAIGDKIHRVAKEPDYYDQMKSALIETDGVIWHGGKSRGEAQKLIESFDVTVGWRAPELDESLELSTKLLEYGAALRPAIMNRNPMHEQLFGADYPLFANSFEGFKDAVRASRVRTTRELATKRCAAASKQFTYSNVRKLLEPYIDRAVPTRRITGKPVKVLVACHDFKFFTRIQDHLAAVRGVELRVDAWKSIREHDEAQSKRLLAWADIIICEWCTDGAIWYSKQKKSDQRLLVRLHRFELYGRYGKQLNIDNVDNVVFVGEFYRDEAKRLLGWPDDKLAVIPNWVDTTQLNRPKVGRAIFNLGMIGIAPKRKRLDRGLTILEKIRERDPRFQLFIKTKMPWAYWWIWQKTDERMHFEKIFERINRSEFLKGAVHFDSFGPDVAAWLRKIGFVLSTSDDESFHLAPAEGMASRALPMLLNWPGSEAIYEQEWIHASEEQVADKILSIVSAGSWQSDGERVREQISAAYSVDRVNAAWEQLVLGAND